MGIDISIGWLTIIMFGSLIVLLMAGLPLAFVLIIVFLVLSTLRRRRIAEGGRD